MSINYNLEPNLSSEEFVSILNDSGLSERRPVDNMGVIENMLRNASVIVTAREETENQLVGVSRAITDFSYCTYLSDLAVHKKFQGKGIGKKLIKETHTHCGLETTLILLSAPKAQSYYPHIGMVKHNSTWILKND